MKMLMVVYRGSAPHRISSLLDAHYGGERLHVAVLPTESLSDIDVRVCPKHFC